MVFYTYRVISVPPDHVAPSTEEGTHRHTQPSGGRHIPKRPQTQFHGPGTAHTWRGAVSGQLVRVVGRVGAIVGQSEGAFVPIPRACGPVSGCGTTIATTRGDTACRPSR